MSSEAFSILYIRSQFHAMERQFALPEIVHGDWMFDMSAGCVRFEHEGEKRAVPVQILGTESEKTGTWLWAWANGMSQIPDAMLRDSRLLEQYGKTNDVPELTETSFDTEVATGHQLAMVAVSLLGAPGYYRCPYEGGAMFVILADPTLNPPPERPFLRMATSLGSILSSIDIVKQRWAVESWFQHYDAQVEAVDNTLIATHANGDVLTVEFDAEERIVGLNTSMKGEAPEA